MNGLYVTRKVFFYTLLTLLPAAALTGSGWRPAVLLRGEVLLNLVFLGVLASAVCVWLWNRVLWQLGTVAVTNLIYLVPLFTLLAAAGLLGERVTFGAVSGGLLIVTGVAFASRRFGAHEL